MPLKYIILSFFTVAAFFLVLFNKKKVAVGMLFFFLPYLAAPFYESSFAFRLGLNAFLIWSIWLGQCFQTAITKEYINWNVISPRINVLYYFLLIGGVLALLHENYYEFTFGNPLSPMTPLESCVNFTLFILTAFFFINIMIEYRYDFQFQDRLLFIFILTSFLQFGSFIFTYLELDSFFPSFLLTNKFDPVSYRFSGLFGGSYELIVDYAMLVIGFSIILLIKGKYIFLTISSMIFGFLMALLSGTRSFFVTLIIFVFLVIVFFIIKFGMSRELIKLSLCALGTLLLINFIINNFIPVETIFNRLDTSIYYFKAGDFQHATNRTWIGSLPNIVNNSGLLGNGSLIISQINKDHMVSHNLYYAIYANYGIIGLFALFFLIFSALSKLCLIIKKSKNKKLSQETIILLAVLISLCIQQLKFSAIRDISGILMYTFLFLLVHFYSLKFMNLPAEAPNNNRFDV